MRVEGGLRVEGGIQAEDLGCRVLWVQGLVWDVTEKSAQVAPFLSCTLSHALSISNPTPHTLRPTPYTLHPLLTFTVSSALSNSPLHPTPRPDPAPRGPCTLDRPPGSRPQPSTLSPHSAPCTPHPLPNPSPLTPHPSPLARHPSPLSPFRDWEHASTLNPHPSPLSSCYWDHASTLSPRP